MLDLPENHLHQQVGFHMSRNPYHADENSRPLLRRSVLAYIDVLGYTELVTRSEREGIQQETLQSLRAALREGRRGLQDEDLPVDLKDFGSFDLYAIKAFTDNIVISWPVRDDAESELGSAFFKLGAFQLEMVLAGYFLRGAIAIGDAFVDEYAVFGSALTEAYRGESQLARDPRIILSSSAVEASKQHLTYYANQRIAPHVHNVLRDADGQWFLNYLECILWAEYEQGPFYEQLMQHKNSVESKLAEFKENPPIWAKYAWVANYHNYFCSLHSHHFSYEHQIPLEKFRNSPSLIVE